MATYLELTEAQTDKGSVIDEDLMRGTAGGSPTGGVRGNFINHEDRILALESAGASGGGADLTEEQLRYAKVIAGLEDDTAKFWRRRYGIFQNIIKGNESSGIEGFDPNGDHEKGVTWIGLEDSENKTTSFTRQTSGVYYNGESIELAKSSAFSFKTKRGVNFFGIGYHSAATTSDNVEIFVNGQTPTAAGLEDETGVAAPDAFSAVSSTTFFGNMVWFFNLDPTKENIIRVLNNDSASKVVRFEFIEIGFASRPGEFTPDEILHLNAGRVTVRGTTINTAETDLTFSSTGIYGRTDAVKVNKTGTLSVLDGIEPAFSQAAPEVNIAFSSGPPATLKLKNVNSFPTQGFVLVQNPYGAKHLASYTGKTGDLLGTLTGMVWESAPSQDFSPLSGFSSTAQANARHDLSVCLWAGGGVLVQSGVNDDIDFSITINGVSSSHSASVPAGLYSADVGPTLESAIVAAMNTAKDLSGTNGEYFASYCKESHRWTIGVRGDEIDNIDFPVNTGGNSATNLMKVSMGFADSDVSGSKSYLAGDETEPLATRVYRLDDNFIDSEDPRIKYNATMSGSLSNTRIDAEGRLGFSSIRRIDGADAIVRFHPDEDAAGVVFATLNIGPSSIYQITVDNGSTVYAIDPTGTHGGASGSDRAQISTYFVPFPKGTKQVSVYPTNEAQHRMYSSQVFFTAGFRQVYTKPAEESLTTSEGIVRSIERAPLSQFKTYYESNYSPVGSNDNVDTVSQTGTWTNAASSQSFNQFASSTTSVNDFQDITFTLQGRGGISVGSLLGATRVRKAAFYLVPGAVGSNAAADLVDVNVQRYDNDLHDQEQFLINDLPAGQYTLRVRHEDSTAANVMIIDMFSIIDEVLPERKVSVSDVTNTGQGVSFPVNGNVYSVIIDSNDRVPQRLLRSGYNDGRAFVDHRLNNSTANDLDDVANVRNYNNYFSNVYQTAGTHQNVKARAFGFCRALAYAPWSFSTYTTSVTATIDSVNEATVLDTSNQLKNGNSPSSVRTGDSPIYSRRFREPLSGTPGSSTVFPVADTRGFRPGMTVLLRDDSEPNLRRTIASIVADTSVTFTEAVTNFANYGTGSNSYIAAPAFHVLDLENNVNVTWGIGKFIFEPLDLLPSNNESRVFKKENKLGEVATVLFRAVANGDDLYFPIFADGRSATWQETSIDIISKSASATYNIDQSLKNIAVSAGTLDIKLTAKRAFQ